MISGLRFVCWAGISLAASAVSVAVEPGMARVNVLQELGRPVAAVARGNTEILTYKDGVRITLKDGKVTEVVGLKPAGGAPATGTPAEAAPAGPKAKVEPEPPVAPPPTKAELEEQARQEKKWAEESAKSRAEMEKSLADLENLHHRPPPRPPEFDVMRFLVGLALKWVLTLAALKLTCKYWGCEVFWSGLMTVAAVDVLVRSAIGLVGFVLLKSSSLFYTDEAIAAFVMVLVLRKVSINQSLAQAVQITMTTKVFSIVVGSALLVVTLNRLH